MNLICGSHHSSERGDYTFICSLRLLNNHSTEQILYENCIIVLTYNNFTPFCHQIIFCIFLENKKRKIGYTFYIGVLQL